jgi:hypothetical protein
MIHRTLVLLSTAVLAWAQPAHPDIHPTHIVALEYPPFARLEVLQGTVEIAVTISTNGSVTEARSMSGETPLSIPAVKVVSKWLFTGCELQEGCHLIIHFSFTLLSGGCTAGQYCPTEFEMDLPDHVSVRAQPFRAIAD